MTVPAKKSITFEVKVDISDAKVLGDDLQTLVDIDKVFPNGYFVEGFISLKDPADSNPELNVPYVGFKGNGTKPQSWMAPNMTKNLSMAWQGEYQQQVKISRILAMTLRGKHSMAKYRDFP
ncbi:Fn3-like domain-containing protein [[Brevibacterium] frigoritolerans]|uniref:Fn3-like domain-containing protein n=1 Tax=Peribacillus frigoritolerans TaxID=450367 RepID=A0A941J4W4_9BACI|nr:Fn3-like domain-containing protein [Peribacillus frigoritolerans]